ncbi:shikimate kinase [Microbacterium sp. gxy059]|uniref:shikimate kinase n=1 Tax=Microbacterium sp. gxy059 TaxID=2957199 RepID=UPI003D998F24
MADGRAVCFIGPMGAGKTSIGRRVAKRLGVPFADTDAAIVRAHGPIAEIFRTRGESAFREIEREAVREAVEAGGVVSLGGGAVLAPETQRLLAEHLVVLLTVSERTVASRIRGGRRPLLAGEDPMAEWRRIGEERRPVYERLADRTFDTSHGPLRRVVDDAAAWAAERLGIELSPAGEHGEGEENAR